MKEIIIIIIILSIIIGSSMYAKNNIEKSSNILVDKLEKLKEEIDIKEEKNREGNIEEKSKEISSEWEKISKSWSAIVLHQELDMIESSLIRIKAEIETKSFEKAIEELDISIFLLEHIVDKEKVSLRNIF